MWSKFLKIIELIITHLQSSIESPLYRDAFGGVGAVCRNSRDETIQLVPFLLEFLDETLDCALRERLALAALAVTHQTMHDAQARIGRRRSLVTHCDAAAAAATKVKVTRKSATIQVLFHVWHGL